MLGFRMLPELFDHRSVFGHWQIVHCKFVSISTLYYHLRWRNVTHSTDILMLVQKFQLFVISNIIAAVLHLWFRGIFVRDLSSRRQRRQLSSDRWESQYKRRSVTSQKTGILSYTALKTSNLAFFIIFRYSGVFRSVTFFPIDPLLV